MSMRWVSLVAVLLIAAGARIVVAAVRGPEVEIVAEHRRARSARAPASPSVPDARTEPEPPPVQGAGHDPQGTARSRAEAWSAYVTRDRTLERWQAVFAEYERAGAVCALRLWRASVYS